MPILRILCLKIGQIRREDEMPKWGSNFGLIPYQKEEVLHGRKSEKNMDGWEFC